MKSTTKKMTVKVKSNKSKMETTADIVKLDRESYSKLKEMFSSPDKENHTVGFGVLKNIDMKINLPYVLLLHKFYHESEPEVWKALEPEINSALKAIKKPKLDSTTYITIYDTVKGNYPDDELQLVLDEYCEAIKERITEWGFEFLKDTEMRILIKK